MSGSATDSYLLFDPDPALKLSIYSKNVDVLCSFAGRFVMMLQQNENASAEMNKKLDFFTNDCALMFTVRFCSLTN